MSEIIITYGEQLGGDRHILYISEHTRHGANMISTIDVTLEPGVIKIDRFILESMLRQLKCLSDKHNKITGYSEHE